MANLLLPPRRLGGGSSAGDQPPAGEVFARYCVGVALFEPAELPGAAVLPLDGAPALPPAEGEALGVAGRVAALEPLLTDELFRLEPELSHAASGKRGKHRRRQQPFLLHHLLHTHSGCSRLGSRDAPGLSTHAYAARLARKMPRKISAAPTRWKSAMCSSRNR